MGTIPLGNWAQTCNLSDKIRSHFYDLSGLLRLLNNGITENKVSTHTFVINIPNSFVTPKAVFQMSWMAYMLGKLFRYLLHYHGVWTILSIPETNSYSGDYSLFIGIQILPIKYRRPYLEMLEMESRIMKKQKIKGIQYISKSRRYPNYIHLKVKLINLTNIVEYRLFD